MWFLEYFEKLRIKLYKALLYVDVQPDSHFHNISVWINDLFKDDVPFYQSTVRAYVDALFPCVRP